MTNPPSTGTVIDAIFLALGQDIDGSLMGLP